MNLARTGLLALIAATAANRASAQDLKPRPEFEVVDIHLNTSGKTAGIGTILPGGQFRAVNIPLKEILKFAYEVRDEAIFGAPAWTETDRYDVTGKGPAVGAEETFWRSTNAVVEMRLAYHWNDTFRLMVQSMLADRFKLAAHQEQRSLSAYALVVTKKGSRLQPAADTSVRPVCTRRVGDGLAAEAVCKNMTMADLAEALQVMSGLYADRNVVDATGLTGAYDFTLDWVGRPNIDDGGLTMPDALDKQLGLKLEGRKVTLPVLVIDRVERPSQN